MSPQVKPSIMFAHGTSADGSCFNKVIPALQAEGYEVASAQYESAPQQSGWTPPPTNSTAAMSPCCPSPTA